MRRCLVVANQTLGGAHLRDVVTERMAQGPCTFHIVVPATAPEEHATYTEGEAQEVAQERLDRAMGWFRGLGAEVGGEVGDARPMLAIGDAMIEREFDEIIVSTLPAGVSRWLKQDLVSRIRRKTELPVTHLIGEPFPAPAP